MKRFPWSGSLSGSLAVAAIGLLVAQPCWAGDSLSVGLLPELLFLGAQGYLGVKLGEIDSDRVAALHLKDNHGAEVTTLDHDAPAVKSGLKMHDVIVQLDGQAVDSADQLRRRLEAMNPGRTVTLLVSRDGNRLPVTVQLCDRSLLEQQAWSNHYSVPEPAAAEAEPVSVRTPSPHSTHSQSFLGGAPSRAPAFLDSVIPRAFYLGADVNPVKPQLADYFGVKSGTGLLVESVDYQSPAARAGMKAGDVVVKVESQSLTSKSDWLKAMHRHRGQPVQVTVMRNKQEQILTMSAGKLKQ